jgi:hypothetical protein
MTTNPHSPNTRPTENRFQVFSCESLSLNPGTVTSFRKQGGDWRRAVEGNQDREAKTGGSDPNATVSDRVTWTRFSLVSVPSVLVRSRAMIGRCCVA